MPSFCTAGKPQQLSASPVGYHSPCKFCLSRQVSSQQCQVTSPHACVTSAHQFPNHQPTFHHNRSAACRLDCCSTFLQYAPAVPSGCCLGMQSSPVVHARRAHAAPMCIARLPCTTAHVIVACKSHPEQIKGGRFLEAGRLVFGERVGPFQFKKREKKVSLKVFFYCKKEGRKKRGGCPPFFPVWQEG